MKLARMFAFAAVAALVATATYAQKNPMVGGKEMFPSKNIIENAVNSADHTTLVAAVKAAGLVDTLQGPGTVHRVRADQRRVQEAAGRRGRQSAEAGEQGRADEVLTYHVVAGRLSSTDLKKEIKAGKRHGAAQDRLRGTLTASLKGNDIMLKDEKGGWSRVTQANVFQSNGVIHVVDTVVMPN